MKKVRYDRECAKVQNRQNRALAYLVMTNYRTVFCDGVFTRARLVAAPMETNGTSQEKKT